VKTGFGIATLWTAVTVFPALSAEEGYYPHLDSPKRIDTSVPEGEGPRFVLRGIASQGDLERILHKLRSKPEQYIVFDEQLPKDRIKQLLLEARTRLVITANHDEKKFFTWYLVDSWAEQAEEKWRAKRSEYIIDHDIGEYRITGGTAGVSEDEILDHKRYRVSARMRGPDGREFYAKIKYSERGDEYLRHEHMRFPNPVRLVRHGSGWTLECRGESISGTWVKWTARGGYYVSVITAGVYPDPVIDAYLRKYPSTLPRDYQYDRNEWGREQVDIVIEELKASLAHPWHDWTDFRVYLSQLTRYVDVQFKTPLNKDTGRKGLETLLAEVEDWARKNRSRLSWDPARGRYMVAEGPAKTAPLVVSRGGGGTALWLFLGLVLATGLGAALHCARRRSRRPPQAAPPKAR